MAWLREAKNKGNKSGKVNEAKKHVNIPKTFFGYTVMILLWHFTV